MHLHYSIVCVLRQQWVNKIGCNNKIITVITERASERANFNCINMQTCKYQPNFVQIWCMHGVQTRRPLVRIYVRRELTTCLQKAAHTADDNNNIHVATGSAAAIWMAAPLSSLHMHTHTTIHINIACDDNNGAPLSIF